jgi:endogenous inhibitor of DNA gyrase (YacG/DUF329 family)
MESTKVVSLRMDRNRYDEILLFCSKRGIPFSEWLEGRLAVADYSDELINQAIENIEFSIRYFDSMPALAKNKLKSLLRDLNNL